MAVTTFTNTVPSLTKEEAIKHLEVYQLAISSLQTMNSMYLRLNNRRYGGRNKTTKASLIENLSYQRGKLHAFETILHMVDENLKAPSFNMSNFIYDEDIKWWSLSPFVDDTIDLRYETYSEKLLQNVK